MSLPDYERHERRGTLDAERCAVDSSLAICPKGYDAGSVSLGALFHAVPDTLDLKAELSSASRFPNADELYLIGAAPTFPVYALGYPDLDPETTWGASATAGLRLWWVEAELSGYANLVRDYVYFAPEFNEDGALHYDVTVRGAFPRYSYRPIDATFHGADGLVQFGPEAPVGLDVGGSMVRAYDDTGAFLVGIPADRGTAALHLRGRGLSTEPTLTLRVDAVAAQSRVDPAMDFAPAPDAYVLLGLGADATLSVREREVRVGVQGDNLLNTAYRDYNSLLRYTADQPGRDIRVRIGSTF
jgi:iron complex outermembrane receptor protein